MLWGHSSTLWQVKRFNGGGEGGACYLCTAFAHVVVPLKNYKKLSYEDIGYLKRVYVYSSRHVYVYMYMYKRREAASCENTTPQDPGSPRKEYRTASGISFIGFSNHETKTEGRYVTQRGPFVACRHLTATPNPLEYCT